CGGASRPRDLSVENRKLPGIHFAMDFLRANTRNLLGGARADFISAKDKDVIVIGGGDTGTDCVATALRHGCRSRVQPDIQRRRPATRGGDAPWAQWRSVHR